MTELKDRLLNNIAIDSRTDCWIWTGCKTSAGYGTLSVSGRQHAAHRKSYEVFNGSIPKGEGHHGTCVCHKCDVPACINPAHLFLGTIYDNIADMYNKGRGAQGERVNHAKLTREQANEIFLLPGTHKKIAEKYGIHKSTVGRIKQGLLWKCRLTPQDRSKP